MKCSVSKGHEVSSEQGHEVFSEQGSIGVQ